MRLIITVLATLSFMAAASVVSAGPRVDAASALTLEDAVSATLERNPSLLAALHEVRSLDGAVSQAGVLPNPALFGEMEEFGGSGGLSGTVAASYKLGISQEFLLGGKRANRIKAAAVELDIGVLRKAALAWDLAGETEKRFIRVYIGQKKLEFETENLELLKRFSDATSRRVELGEAPALEETRAMVELSTVKLSVERARNELETAKVALALMWDGTPSGFSGIEADYGTAPAVPADAELAASLTRNPIYLALVKEVELADASLQIARSGAWPDVEVGCGVQVFNETSEHAFFFEFSIPIPVFDSNSGGIRKAVENVNRAAGMKSAGLLELKTKLAVTVGSLRSAIAEYTVMVENVEPAAKEAYDAVGKAYMVGEQSYLEFSEARRAYLEIRRESVRLLEEMLILETELRLLTSGPPGGLVSASAK